MGRNLGRAACNLIHVETKASRINLAMGAQIKAEQAGKHLTSEQMAERTGINLTTYNRIVSKTPRDINVTQVEAIAEVVGLHPAELVRAAVERANRDRMSEVAAHDVPTIPRRPVTAEDFDTYQGDRAATGIDEESERDEED